MKTPRRSPLTFLALTLLLPGALALATPAKAQWGYWGPGYGGYGGYGFTVIGVLVLQVLSSFLIGIGLKYEWQQFIFGILILPMVALYSRQPSIRAQV